MSREHKDQHHHHHDHHDHHEHHGAHHHKTGELTFTEKAAKLLAHWQQHNDEHAGNYRRWAEEFRLNGLSEAAVLLDSAADLTLQINHIFDQAAQLVSAPDQER